MNYKEVKTTLNLAEHAKSASVANIFIHEVGLARIEMEERKHSMNDTGDYREWRVYLEGYCKPDLDQSLMQGTKKFNLPYADRKIEGNVWVENISIVDGYLKMSLIGEGALVDDYSC